jgi:NAD kinase
MAENESQPNEIVPQPKKGEGKSTSIERRIEQFSATMFGFRSGRDAFLEKLDSQQIGKVLDNAEKDSVRVHERAQKILFSRRNRSGNWNLLAVLELQQNGTH